MSNSFNRRFAFEIGSVFEHVFESLGFLFEPPAPIVDLTTESLLFTGATINAVKASVVNGELPHPGYLLRQDCIRLQNLKHLGDASFLPGYMSCFCMVSVCASPRSKDAVREGVLNFLGMLKSRWEGKIVLSRHENELLIAQDFCLDTMADGIIARDHPMTWTYGLGNHLTGRGLDISVGRSENTARSVGQLVELYSNGQTVGFEFGFGIETLGAALAGQPGPFNCSPLSQFIEIQQTPFFIQALDIVLTLCWLASAGIRSGNDTRGSTVRKMLRLLPAIAECAGLKLQDVLTLLAHGASEFIDSECFLDGLKSDVVRSWEGRSKALALGLAYVTNQLHIVELGMQTLQEACDRTRAYLYGLGKFLPIEINNTVTEMSAGSVSYLQSLAQSHAL